MPKEFLTFDIRIDDWNKSVTMISIDISLDRKETTTISFFFFDCRSCNRLANNLRCRDKTAKRLTLIHAE